MKITLSRWAVYAAIVVQTLLFAACAAIPRFEGVEGSAASVNPPPRLSNSHGPLTAKQSKAILDKLRRQTPDADVLGRHLAFTQEISASPLTVGNKVTVLRDGAASFKAIFQAITAAKDSIHLEYFIFENVELEGRKLADVLVEKQTAGVQVNLIYDAAGSISTPGALFDRLKAAGIKVVQFNPLDPFKGKTEYAPNDRGHRKIMVVDGSIAIIGGVNLSEVYSSNIFSAGRGTKKCAVSGVTPIFSWKDQRLAICSGCFLILGSGSMVQLWNRENSSRRRAPSAIRLLASLGVRRRIPCLFITSRCCRPFATPRAAFG